MDAYSNREFDASQIEASARSAAFIVPVLCKLFPWIRSVINVGCGTGTWLHEFDLHGIPRLLGLESGNVPARLLQIEPSQFRIADFGGSWGIEDRFDLVLSLEIAQQLPPECVENFVGQLTRLSDVIVFSPAIPALDGQLRWDERGSSFWAAHFELIGYECFDLLRNIFWYDQRVEWGYSQNILIFIAKHRADLIADLRKQQISYERPLNVVHPRGFQISVNSEEALLVRLNIVEERSEILDAQLRQSEGRGAMLAAQLRHSDEQCGMLATQLQRSEEHSAMLATQLQRIESSTTWRVTALLRRSLERRPKLRLFVRRTAKLICWTATGRLPGKFLEWRRSRRPTA